MITKDDSDKGKPGESRRRKAMGLTSQLCDHDRQATEDQIAAEIHLPAWLRKRTRPDFIGRLLQPELSGMEPSKSSRSIRANPVKAGDAKLRV